MRALGADAIARGGRRRVRSVAVDVARGKDLSVVEVARGLGAVEKEPCADHLVVAGVGGKLRARLADAVPVLRRLEYEHVLELVEAVTKPFAEQ
jgi:hypothetical protein